ncbi:hypothetical protein EJK17_00640 [Lactobacillus xujianguonis]|uniref:Uncharacterized protein n=1 Tax=Lactobacillus xujianguonis TaxID=2495899 RepID=A0A437SY20_9LACO|nr:hypothetical protein [Lactobacillus xujianguonis]RVU71815.1 hypothetical protein EJK17_00640 [Lactobacillus xujianguonis]
MKKKVLTLFLTLFAVTALGMSSNVQMAQAKVKTTKYTYVDKHSIIYGNKKGHMWIRKVYGYRMLDIDGNYEYSRIIVTGIFTNRSKHNVSPLDFFNQHFKMFQVTKNAWHDLDPEGPIPDAPTDYFDELGNDGISHVRPHKYVEFAFSDDDVPVKLHKHQKIVVRAYHDAYLPSKKLATKTFKLGGIESTMSADDSEILAEEDD